MTTTTRPTSGPTRTRRPATRRPAPVARPRPKTEPVEPVRRSAAPPRAPFVLLVVALLGGALVSLLLLNTVLAQDAFTLTELQRGNQQLQQRVQQLKADNAREQTPEVLHRKAIALGMQDPQRLDFISPLTGRPTLGDTRPAGVPDEAVAATAATGVVGTPGPVVPPAGGGRR